MTHYIRYFTGIALIFASAGALATVSHVFVSNNGDKTMSVLQCVTSNGKEPITCKERERIDASQINVNSSWPGRDSRIHGSQHWCRTLRRGDISELNIVATPQCSWMHRPPERSPPSSFRSLTI